MKKSLPGLAIFLTFAIICSYIESLIPIPFGVPGMKLGLTNVVIVLMLYMFGPFEAFIVSMLRVLLIGFMFGNLYSIAYSLAGGLLSFICMYLIKRFGKFRMITVSVVGGFTHNLGQLLVAMFFFDTPYLIYYLPVLLITGVVTGAIIGIIAQAVYSRVEKFANSIDEKNQTDNIKQSENVKQTDSKADNTDINQS
ncbi:MAG: Gx transporter family protein [Lachnospiraceae bacterium]|nr:Gx transporter family protein [Lachnospiraceae bacterium]